MNSPVGYRHAFVVVALALGVSLVVVVGFVGLGWFALTQLGLLGATFGFPDEPPVPPGATVVAQAEGRDDDDPMRGREILIDMGAAPEVDLVRYYRERFPSDAGWVDGMPDRDVGGGHLLCLVSHAEDDFDEYVEIYGSDDESRFVASISRLHVHDKDGRSINRCGLAGNWYPDPELLD